MAVKPKRKKVKLLKGVRIQGKHVDAGKRIEVDQALANDMIASNQAVLDEDEEEEHEDLDPEEMGVQIVHPNNADPGHSELPPAGAKPKVVDKRKSDDKK